MQLVSHFWRLVNGHVLARPVFRALVVSIGLAALVYTPLFVGQTVYFADNFSLMVPGKIFTAHWLSQGILPLWNPLLFGGLPWIGDINQSILYPLTLLFVILPPGMAVSATVLIQIVLSLLGMLLLARRMGLKEWQGYLAAVLWTFSPQVTGAVNNLSTLQSITWFPWVVLAGLGIRTWKGATLFSIVVLVQLAGGYPQHVLYAVLTAVVVSIWQAKMGLSRQSGKIWLAWFFQWLRSGVLVLLVTAVLWLPFLPVLSDSTRTIQTAEQAASGSLQPAEIVKIILPAIFDLPSLGMKWGVSWAKPPNFFLYFSWFGLLVAGVALLQRRLGSRDWWLLGMSALSLIIAFGDSLPTFALLQHIPILNNTRGVSTILMIPALLGSIMIARWVGEVRLSGKILAIVRSAAVFIFITSVVAVAVVFVAFTPAWQAADQLLAGRISQSAFHTLERDQVIMQVLTLSGLVLSLSLLLSLYFWQRRRYGVLVVVLALEMAFATQGHLFYADSTIYDQDDTFARQLQAQTDTSQYRVLTRNYNSPYADFGAYWDALSVRAPFSDSYIDAEELKALAHLQRMRDGLTPSWQQTVGIPTINGYTTLVPKDMHDQFADTSEASINRLPQIMIDNPLLSHWSVGYYVVDTWFPDYDEPMPDTLVFETEAWRVYELPDTQPRFRTVNGGLVEIEALTETSNSIRATVDIPDDSGFLIADRYDADWTVRVDGQEQELKEFQGLRLIALDVGRHEVELQYHPRWFYLGALITGLTLMLSLGSLLVLPKLRRFSTLSQ